MAENSGIEWTTHTFNPWIGCTKISAACDHCYAEAWDKRFNGERWGPNAPRTRTKTWGNPVKWNRQAGESGERPRVFCASLADVFDNHRSIDPAWRRELWLLIRSTPNLDWLLLTKRPQNIVKMLPDDWRDGYANVWLGATVENQAAADRIGALTKVPARIRFLSMEPLVGPVDLSEHIDRLDWVITGGENGAHYRPANPDWFRSLRNQCAAAGVAFLFKQWEGRNQSEIKAKGRELDGVVHDGYPAPLAAVQ
jgi:protein gp37